MMLHDYLPALRYGAKITPSEVAGGFGGGNVYYAKKSTDSDYAAFLSDFYTTYNDGTVSVYNTIQDAVNASQDKRGDTVVVSAGDYTSSTNKWKENVIIKKAGLKIIAQTPGWESQMRPGDATTKYPLAGDITVSSFGFLVMARSVEISGFLVDGGGGNGGIYIGDGVNVTGSGLVGSGGNSASAWIHDCVLRGGSEGNYGIVLEGASANVLVENNIIERWTSAGVWLGPGGGRTTQNPVIRYNEFWAGNAAYGLDMYNANTTVGALIRGNSFRDGSSLTFTNAIRCQGTGVHSVVGNFFACTNKITASSTDFVSGNFTSAAGNSVNYVSVA